jgi:tRNA acetyltransferase TAN1
LLDSFNLLVSSARGEERDANSELRYLLGELGDLTAQTDFTPVSGLTVAKTELDPIVLIGRLRSTLNTRPWEFRYVLKVKPIMKVVQSSIEDITQAAVLQSKVIGENETYRVSVEKRQSAIVSKQVIDAIASKIPRKVDLQDPGRVILVEIISHLAGISVIRPNEILGVEKEKRSTSSEPPAALTVR